jgi:hypothetical protein
MNIDLKVGLIRRYGSQIVASKKLGIGNSKLSYLVRGHAEPTQHERDVLKEALGADYFESQPPSAA